VVLLGNNRGPLAWGVATDHAFFNDPDAPLRMSREAPLQRSNALVVPVKLLAVICDAESPQRQMAWHARGLAGVAGEARPAGAWRMPGLGPLRGAADPGSLLHRLVRNTQEALASQPFLQMLRLAAMGVLQTEPVRACTDRVSLRAAPVTLRAGMRPKRRPTLACANNSLVFAHFNATRADAPLVHEPRSAPALCALA